MSNTPELIMPVAPAGINTSRLEGPLSTDRLSDAIVAVLGVGGSMTKLESLARCGVRRFKLCDFDVVEPTNVARQGHEAIGQLKVEAAAHRLKQINSSVEVTTVPLDCTTLSDEEAARIFSDAHLIIVTVDRFTADAWANQLALRLQVPTMWIGVYGGAGGAEIVFWHPGLESCFRCVMEHRYRLQHEASENGVSLDPASDGTLFQDIMIVDGIAGHIALGLLTRGEDNYFGRLIDELGDRQFLQMKLRHDWLLRGQDPVRHVLGISNENDSYFCWNTIARRNGPMAGPCPDCEALRGHRFEEQVDDDGRKHFVRILPETDALDVVRTIPGDAQVVPTTVEDETDSEPDSVSL